MHFCAKIHLALKEEPCYENFSLVGAMWHDAKKTILEFAGTNPESNRVNENGDRKYSRSSRYD